MGSPAPATAAGPRCYRMYDAITFHDMKLGPISVAALTPRRDVGYEADLAAMLELVDFLCAAGVNGIALMGSTGEFLHLSLEDRAHLVKLVVKGSRCPVIAGVTHSSLDGTVMLADQAARAG